MAGSFLTQFGALYVKNALVAWRNRRATILRLLAPFLFLLLALLIDRALRADSSTNDDFSDIRRPASDPIGPIPRCNEDLYIGKKPCIELVYSPDNVVTRDLMGNVTTRNAKPITARGFPSRAEVQRFLLANPDYAIGAVHFVFDDESLPDPALQGFVVQTNTTIKNFKSTYQDPNKFVQLPLQSAVHREIARRQLLKTPATAPLADQLSWYIGLKTFAHPTIATVSVLGQVLGPFVFAACMFSFVIQIGSMVMEKEAGLRQALRTMGMRDAAYWASWAAWELTLAFLTGHLIAIFGLILQFNLFLNNNYGLLFFLFFLFQLAMSSLAMLLSTFMSRTQSAVYLGFVIFIVGWVMQTVVIFGVPYTPDYWTTTPIGTALTVIFSVFPWDLLIKGFQDLGSATVDDSSPGLRWSERSRYCQNIEQLDAQEAWSNNNNYDPRTQYVTFNCVMPLDTIYKVFIALWLGFIVLAIYMDNVLKNENGVRRPLLYFLYPSYWLPSTTAPTAALQHVLGEDSKGPGAGGPGSGAAPGEEVDEDVLAEEARVRQLLNHRTGHTSKEGELAAAVDVRNAIEVFGLKKRYDGSSGCCGRSWVCCSAFDCCSCRAVPAFWPIKGSWLAIEQDQLFCLLGPNGAGKTTTINCLTGVLPPTHGDALVYGQSIRSTGGMDKIRSLMGVCPQFDVLWPELTGAEHLTLYGRVKGCGWKGVEPESARLLEKVKLTYAAGQRTGAYSGGMKRRLSVAIALLGDPKVVYLDEPTTGMDPISRRYVWDIIQEAKVGRAIVLTTHSMEEADILGDRIAIMALGRLRCLGSSIRLKQRFGAGYEVSVSVQPPRASQLSLQELAQRSDGAKQYFATKLGLSPADEGRAYTTFLIPRERESELAGFLTQLEKDAPGLGITDVQLSLTSLEEVFLTIARKAAIEAARTSGTADKSDHTSEVQLPDGSTVKVQPGQEFVQDSNGVTYSVMWTVDDGGNLVAQETRLAPVGATTAAMAGAYGAVTMANPAAGLQYNGNGGYYPGGIPVAAVAAPPGYVSSP